MEQKIIQLIQSQSGISAKSISNTVQLLSEGATIPFIARYRKEVTGELDEVEISTIKTLKEKFEYIIQRKETILSTINEQGKLSDELKSKIENSWDLLELEDLYLPYKPKRKTKATIAKEKGLEPLAKTIFEQKNVDVEDAAEGYLNDDVLSVEDAIKGSIDIISEWISENILVRQKIRSQFHKRGIVYSKVVKDKIVEAEKFKDYFDFSEPVYKIPAHRLLAVFRGENEGFLRVMVDIDKDEALEIIERIIIKSNNQTTSYLKTACENSYDRLIAASIENDIRNELKEKADLDSIHIFGENLRQILMYPPLRDKSILALDPGYRTGCKIVCIDATGKLLYDDVIYPHPPQSDITTAKSKLTNALIKYNIQAIAVGNGTAGRESEVFVSNLVKNFDTKIDVFSVNESGASIYSASDVAREEFPNYDVTVRGAISIGRRLADPLAELVKIDAKSIGVGQYQHDVNQTLLKKSLDEVVVSCVNQVGVNLNTASAHLLKYVSGIGEVLAKNIVKYRDENGEFKERKEILKVPRFGEKAYEQAAGFLRIHNGKNPLDNTAVHPERYELVKKMCTDYNIDIKSLLTDVKKIDSLPIKNYVSAEVGLPTLQDIIAELKKPGRDPRMDVEKVEFLDTIKSIEDLEIGMELNGKVTNIANFGAFVDIGVKQDGLVHISEISYEFVKNIHDAIKLNQIVKVKVTEVDVNRKRINLTMKL